MCVFLNREGWLVIVVIIKPGSPNKTTSSGHTSHYEFSRPWSGNCRAVQCSCLPACTGASVHQSRLRYMWLCLRSKVPIQCADHDVLIVHYRPETTLVTVRFEDCLTMSCCYWILMACLFFSPFPVLKENSFLFLGEFNIEATNTVKVLLFFTNIHKYNSLLLVTRCGETEITHTREQIWPFILMCLCLWGLKDQD